MERLLATGAFALLLAGYSHDPGALDAPDSPVARYDWSSRDGGMDALLEGTLEVRDGCLVVNPPWDDADTVVVPGFPRAYASWNDETQTLTYGGVAYEMGDPVAAGGGWGPPREGMDIPDACEPDAHGDVMHVQDTSLAPMNERGF